MQLGFLLLITDTETDAQPLSQECVHLWQWVAMAIHCSYEVPHIVVYKDHACLCPLRHL